MAGTMVAFNPRGDHFIPPPVPLGRWGLPLLIFLRFFLCIIAKKKWVGRVGNVWIKGVACCFSLVKLSLCNSKRKLSESRADSLWSRRVREQRNAPDRFQSEVFGREGFGSSEMLPIDSKAKSLVVVWARKPTNVWIKGVACRFSFVAFLLPSQKKSGRVQSGSL